MPRHWDQKLRLDLGLSGSKSRFRIFHLYNAAKQCFHNLSERSFSLGNLRISALYYVVSLAGPYSNLCSPSKTSRRNTAKGRNTQDDNTMKKKTHTQQSSSSSHQVPTYYIDITTIIIHQHFCTTSYYSNSVEQPRLSWLRKFFYGVNNKIYE